MPGKLLWLEERKEAGTLPMPNWLLRHPVHPASESESIDRNRMEEAGG